MREHRADELVFPIAALGKGEERGIKPVLPPSNPIKMHSKVTFDLIAEIVLPLFCFVSLY